MQPVLFDKNALHKVRTKTLFFFNLQKRKIIYTYVQFFSNQLKMRVTKFLLDFQMLPLKFVMFCLDVGDCGSTPCQNGGQCIDENDKFSCKCVPGSTGDTCETG